MKNNIDVIEKAQLDRLNQALKTFGFTISGGSYDWDTDTWSIGLNADYNPHYNKDQIAKRLMKELGEKRIILDSQLFTSQGLCDHERRARRLYSEQMNKKVLA